MPKKSRRNIKKPLEKGWKSSPKSMELIRPKRNDDTKYDKSN